ncbi:MAG: DUF4097 domain-containing protein [Bdellovibrionales bacterium]
MKSALLLALVFSSTAFGLTVKATTDKYQFKAEAIKSAFVHNSTGNVHIAPVVSKTAYVIVNKIKWGPRCSANIDLVDGQLKVETDDTAWILDHECRVDLIISLPSQIPLQIRAGTGDIKVIATRGDVDVKVGSGLIALKGEINNLKALSGSGDVRMEGRAQSADIKTGSGDIEMDYSTAPDKGRLALKTGSGDVQVFLPESTKVKSQISTGNGTVVNEFNAAENTERLDVDAASETGNIQIRKK